MKKIRIGTMVAVLFVGMASFARAQDSAAGDSHGPNMRAMMMNSITLTAAQQFRIDAVERKYGQQIAALHAEERNGGDVQAVGEKMRDVRKHEFEEIKTVLTADQRSIFDKNVEDMRARMPKAHAPSSPPTV